MRIDTDNFEHELFKQGLLKTAPKLNNLKQYQNNPEQRKKILEECADDIKDYIADVIVGKICMHSLDTMGIKCVNRENLLKTIYNYRKKELLID